MPVVARDVLGGASAVRSQVIEANDEWLVGRSYISQKSMATLSDPGPQSASTSDPPITALDLHPAEHAAAAVELLVARVEGEHQVRTRSVKATLRVRQSTRGA